MVQQINTKQLKEWNLENLKGFIKVESDKENNIIKAHFVGTTVVISVESDLNHDEELSVLLYSEPNNMEPIGSDIKLVDLDVCTSSATLYLSNGKEISLIINYTDDCDSSGSYSNVPYTIIHNI